MKVGCNDRDKVFKTSEASTKSWFRVNGLIDKYLNILDLKGFRKNNTKWSNYARVKHGVEGRLFYEENNGTKAVPNKEMFKKIDNAKGIFYQTDKPIKPGVQELFESNPKLANQIYEALGFQGSYNQPNTQQKQQAQQLYSQYLESLNNPDTNPILQGNKTIDESEITYTDEEGNPCAKMGGRTSTFTKGSKWEIVKDLKGYPSHAQGGVDIKLGKDGFSFARGEGEIKAAHGLVLPAIKAQDGLVINPEYEAMSKVLSQRNKHLNWVERGLNPDNYPKIDNGDGTFSTHKLAYRTGDNGEAYVYPTIIQNEKGELEELDDNASWEYAMKTKTAMVIPNVKLAEYYSQNGLIKH